MVEITHGTSVQDGPIKVLFGVPTYNSTPCFEFSVSKSATDLLLLQNGIDTGWFYLPGDPYVHRSRNKIASEFHSRLKVFTHLFFIDDDLGWEPEAVLRLVRAPFDVVGGIYPKKNNDGGEPEFPVELRLEKMDNGELRPIIHEGCYLGSLLPTGFMCIRRHVIEKAAQESGEYLDYDKKRGYVHCWDFFRTGWIASEQGSKMGRWWGEDFFFSAMVEQLGMNCWVDPNIKFTHRGSKAWEANLIDTLDKLIEEKCNKGPQAHYVVEPKFEGKVNASPLTWALDEAFKKANSAITKLPASVLALDGMSGTKFRMFLNNLVEKVSTDRGEYTGYLEIGSWKGSTAASACWGNRVYATCIDNWSQFGGPKEDFLRVMHGTAEEYVIIEEDYKTVYYKGLIPNTIYFYDGPHSPEDQFLASTVALDALEDEFVFIVDDWNWPDVREATMKGINEAGFEILYSIDLRTGPDGYNAPIFVGRTEWHNGMYAAVLRRK